MRATGIVRRIDDLGRVVIPREIRQTMGIKENDSLEIFVEDGSIIFKKYSTIPNVLENLCDARDIMDEDNPFYKELCSLISRIKKAGN